MSASLLERAAARVRNSRAPSLVRGGHQLLLAWPDPQRPMERCRYIERTCSSASVARRAEDLHALLRHPESPAERFITAVEHAEAAVYAARRRCWRHRS